MIRISCDFQRKEMFQTLSKSRKPGKRKIGKKKKCFKDRWICFTGKNLDQFLFV